MKLIGFKFESEKGKHKPYVSERFQFFYHYWSLITSKHNRLLFLNDKFESHRSLLAKTINTLEDSFKDSQKKYNRFFKDHHYFDSSNVVLKDLSIIGLVTSTKSLEYNTNKQLLIYNLKKIEAFLTKKVNYPKHLSKKLVKILRTDTPLDSLVEKYLVFLINSLVIELYNDKYPIDYIRKIPDIITFNDQMNRFPFEKTLEDFDFNEDQFKEYQSKHKPTLSLFISGITNLIERKKFKGYIIYKVFNLDLKLDEPLKIGNAVIYNPATNSILEQERYNEINSIEKFYDHKQDFPSLFRRESKCNIYYPIELRYPFENLKLRKEVYESFKYLKSSLNLFCNDYRIRNPRLINISEDHFFLMSTDNKPAFYSLEIFGNTNLEEIGNDEDLDKYYKYKIDNYSKLDSSLTLHKNLMEIIERQVFFKSNPNEFSFSQLWIAWEAFIDVNQFKSLAKVCLKKRMGKNYLGDIIMLMRAYLWDYMPGSQKNWIHLSEMEMKKYGLHTEFLKPLQIRKFTNNYKNLLRKLDLSFLKIIEDKIDKFLNNKNTFYAELNNWVVNTIDEFNIERNAEVHSNQKNKFSQLKLKEDVLYISELCTNMLLDNMNFSNKKDYQKIYTKIKK